VKAINTPGVIPNVQTAWETFVMTKCSEAVNATLKAYDVIMVSRLAGQLPCDNEEIRNSHEAALEQGIAELQAETMGISDVTTEKYLRELTVRSDRQDKNVLLRMTSISTSWQIKWEKLTS